MPTIDEQRRHSSVGLALDLDDDEAGHRIPDMLRLMESEPDATAVVVMRDPSILLIGDVTPINDYYQRLGVKPQRHRGWRPDPVHLYLRDAMKVTGNTVTQLRVERIALADVQRLIFSLPSPGQAN